MKMPTYTYPLDMLPTPFQHRQCLVEIENALSPCQTMEMHQQHPSAWPPYQKIFQMLLVYVDALQYTAQQRHMIGKSWRRLYERGSLGGCCNHIQVCCCFGGGGGGAAVQVGGACVQESLQYMYTYIYAHNHICIRYAIHNIILHAQSHMQYYTRTIT